MRARVIVVAGPSGSGKSRLAERLELPALRLDDFDRSAGDATLPRRVDGLVDRGDPRSWLQAEACAALEPLWRGGVAEGIERVARL